MTEDTVTRSDVAPYLFFSGRCAEAISFYQDRLNAELEMVMRFDESPDPVPEGMLQPGFETAVMHASLKIAGQRILLSDGCDDKSCFSGFRLALTVPEKVDAERYFNALADGGTVDMPLGETFWSPCYGMVTDRFQVGWMVMVACPQQP